MATEEERKKKFRSMEKVFSLDHLIKLAQEERLVSYLGGVPMCAKYYATGSCTRVWDDIRHGRIRIWPKEGLK